MSHSSAFEKRIRYQFEFFCKKVIDGERCDYLRWLQRYKEHEACFSELSVPCLEKLCSTTDCPDNNYIFDLFGYRLHVRNDWLAETLLSFDVEERSILILSYAMDLSDLEISNLLGTSRSRVQRLRVKLFEMLKHKMRGCST